MEITLSKKAAKALEGIEASTKDRVIAGIQKIPQGDIKPLRGYEGLYRLRVGDWRIVFSYLDRDKVLIDRIAPRGQAYKGV